MLSSGLEAGRLGTDTPISSADSRRVETDDLRRWCEFGRCLGGPEGHTDMSFVELAEDEDESEVFDIEVIEVIEVFRECERECDRPWECWGRPGETRGVEGRPGPSLNDSNCEKVSEYNDRRIKDTTLTLCLAARVCSLVLTERS